ncbi:hypothetical protein DFH29DRAFT_995570 [Suillus ampliporus]|nr:hypothetical protein DFH29DRAFT_995570 [Suillus ampliporus]
MSHVMPAPAVPGVEASRKFIDLIRQTSSKWANWDSSSKIKMGDYGMIDGKTGELQVEGKIYDEAFQELLNKQCLTINLSDSSCKPTKGPVEDDIVISSMRVKNGEFLLKPEVILNLILEANELKDKYLVASTFTCPAYYLYLSNKSAERVALALVAAAGGDFMGWWTDTQTTFLRKECDKSGQYRCKPLYTLERRGDWFRRLFRTRNYLWSDNILPQASQELSNSASDLLQDLTN